MKNKCNPMLEKVSFAFTYTAVEEAVMSDSSYIARSLYDVAAEKPQVTPLIITEDDKPFIVEQVTQACADIVTRLAVYIAEETQFEDEPYTFVFTLPTCRNASVDALIRHELLRAIATHVLSRWYEVRLPAVAAREQQLYDAAIAMLRHDIFMAHGPVRRAGSYL